MSEIVKLVLLLIGDIGNLLGAKNEEEERVQLILMQRRIQEEIARRVLPPG